MDLPAMVNRHVTLQGVALNALGNAVIADPDEEWFVYIDGLECWDDDLYGNNVEVAGLLVRAAIAPEATSDGGRHSQGAVGKALVIRNARWRLSG